MKISWNLYDSLNNAITGGAANTSLKIRRKSDGQMLDWNDLTFKAAGWTTLATTLSEVDATNLAGAYEKDVTITTWSDGWYQAISRYAAGAVTLNGVMEFLVRDGKMVEEAAYDMLETPGGLVGTYKVTLQIYLTATVTPIADVLVDVYDSMNTTRMNGSYLTSAANGQVEFYRNNGTYKIRLMKAGVTFATGTVVVNNADVSVTLYGTAVAADAPPTAPAIRVYEFCFMPDGVTPMASTAIRAKAKIIGLPYDYNGRYHYGQEIDGTYNAATGKVYWDLAPGASVDFFIRDFHSQHVTKTVPLTDPDNEIRLEDMP